MPDSNIAISVCNLTKTYRLFGHPGDRIKQFLSLGFRQYHREFTALNNVPSDIKKGGAVTPFSGIGKHIGQTARPHSSAVYVRT